MAWKPIDIDPVNITRSSARKACKLLQSSFICLPTYVGTHEETPRTTSCGTVAALCFCTEFLLFDIGLVKLSVDDDSG